MSLLIGTEKLAAQLILLTFVLLGVGLPAYGEDVSEDSSTSSSPVAPPETIEPSSETMEDGIFFADVLVRGQPVLQVGSLPELSAADRARVISRRIAGLLNQPNAIEPVTVQLDPSRQMALLKVNNRVLMTVTSQDAVDFDVTIETLAQQWADRLNQVLVQPNLAVDALQRLDGTGRQLVGRTIDLVPSLLGAFFIVGVTWTVARGVRRLGLLWAEETEGDRSTEILIGRLCYGGVWVLGSVIALGVLGLDFAALLGALGLTSVAIGFSLKDVLSNYMSGVILLAARPFRINDQVVIGDYEGTIVQVQLRATTMITYDGRLVYIPNQKVFQSSVINNTASPVRRSDVMVGVDCDADINAARQAILDALTLVPGIEVEPAPLVLVQELAASTVNLKVRFWVNSRQQSFLQVTSDAAQAIQEKLRAVGIEMPTEIYTLMFRDFPIKPQTISPE
ncbi:MAG TPA: mechanosensitive ion channel family protein [Candidatus Obscuribacterales bacterium]